MPSAQRTQALTGGPVQTKVADQSQDTSGPVAENEPVRSHGPFGHKSFVEVCKEIGEGIKALVEAGVGGAEAGRLAASIYTGSCRD